MTLCIIPARGGSKGIPLKNVMPICGHPLLAWSIRQALAAKLIDRVVVSTDCAEIADVVLDEGAEVFWRSPATATDEATTESAVLDVLEQHEDPDPVTVLLQATSPCRPTGMLDKAITYFGASRAGSVFSARRIEGYIWRTHNSPPQLANGPRVRRQERTIDYWEENGSFYIFNTQLFLEQRTRLCGRVAMFEMEPLDSFQIDEYADAERLEQLMQLRLRNVSNVGYPN